MAFSRVKQFKDIIVDYDAASGATLKVYTDMPGTAMAQRGATLTLPATAGRQTKVFPLDGIEGTLVRFEFGSAAVLRLYGATLRMRPVGVYLDGAAGEVWKTTEMGFGVN